jgi:hypothetical protein
MNNWIDDRLLDIETWVEKQYEDAYAMISAERHENVLLRQQIERHEQEIKDIKAHLVDKLDHFLMLKGEEFFASLAKKDFAAVGQIRDDAAALVNDLKDIEDADEKMRHYIISQTSGQ